MVWGGYGVAADKAAEVLLAELFELDTYERQINFLKENGDLVRKLRKNVDGTRSTHYRIGKKFTALGNGKLVYLEGGKAY